MMANSNKVKIKGFEIGFSTIEISGHVDGLSGVVNMYAYENVTGNQVSYTLHYKRTGGNDPVDSFIVRASGHEGPSLYKAGVTGAEATDYKTHSRVKLFEGATARFDEIGGTRQ